MNSGHLAPSILLAIALIAPTFNSASAAGDEFIQLIETLKENKTLTGQQFDELMEALDDADTGEDESAVQIITEGGLEMGSYDGAFSFEFGGRLMVDLAAYSEDQANLGNGSELRKATLEAEGMLFREWGYELGFDFSGSDADIKDAYIEYRGNWPTRLFFGQYKEPFSLEELTSSRYLTFMERALPNEFAPGRQIGAGAITRGEGWTAAAGIFGGAFDDDVGGEGDEGWSLTGRATYAPWRDDRKAFHLGGAISHRTPDDDKEVKYNARPESHITDVKYLNTDDIANVKNVHLYVLETALVQGPFSLQAEYIQAQVKRESGQEDLEFDGWYVFGSWFLTGESRIYKEKKGGFGRINPTTDSGAWEIALRFSNLNLTDQDITGGESEQITLGLNWYANPRTRFMLNYIRVDNDANADDAGDVNGNDDPEILQLRAQIDF